MSQPIIPSVQLHITVDERNMLIEFIDAAVKAIGLNCAQNAVHLATRLKNAPLVAVPPAPIVINPPADITDVPGSGS